MLMAAGAQRTAGRAGRGLQPEAAAAAAGKARHSE